MKKLLTLLMTLAISLSLFGCAAPDTQKTNVLDSAEAVDVSALKASGSAEKEKLGYQFEMPKTGEEIAVVTTTMGTFKMRFFPEAAPKAVYNFKKLALDGYYTGIIFHRVINNFMIQGGDPTGTGRGGESTWGTAFTDEFSSKLLNFTGSVAMANSGENTNGSQFFVNNNPTAPDWANFDAMYEYYKGDPDTFTKTYGSIPNMEKVNDDIRKLYTEKGGNINLDGGLSTINKGHTVFAQVFEGMDVINAISGAPTNNPNDNKPITDVAIEKVEIVAYSPN